MSADVTATPALTVEGGPSGPTSAGRRIVTDGTFWITRP